jgi:hypothetical protein
MATSKKFPVLLTTTGSRSWIFQPASVRASTSSEAQRKATITTELPYKSAIRDEASETGTIQRHFTWSPTALFRFSALTYNGHMVSGGRRLPRTRCPRPIEPDQHARLLARRAREWWWRPTTTNLDPVSGSCAAIRGVSVYDRGWYSERAGRRC